MDDFYGLDSEDAELIRNAYSQPWRYHHGVKHIESMMMKLSASEFANDSTMKYAVLWHDYVYEPGADDNEERSVEAWMEATKGVQHTTRDAVAKIIMSTKEPEKCEYGTRAYALNAWDWNGMGKVREIAPEYGRWLDQYEEDIFREHQKWPVQKYVEGRLAFIENAVSRGLMTPEVAAYLLPLVMRKRRVGIYAGSFTPFHKGHLNVIKKAERMFDKVIVAKGINPEKAAVGTEEFDNLQGTLRHHEVDMYFGQLVEYFNWKRDDLVEPVLVRGLRNGYDLSYEVNFMNFVNEQADARNCERIPITYIHCDREYEHVSSSAIRMLPKEDRERYLPDPQ